MPLFTLTTIQPYAVDVLLGVFLLWFAVLGYRRGIVQTIGQLLGAVAGFWIAKTWALPISHTVGLIVPLSAAVIQIVVFILIFLVADRLVGLVFWLLDKFFKIVTLLPFLSTLDTLLGALIGLFEGVFLVGSLSYIIITLHFDPRWMSWISSSHIATFSQTVFYRALGFLI